MMEYIEISGIKIDIIRKKIKNMYLRVTKDKKVVVSAPIFVPDEEIQKFVYSKEAWLKEAISREKTLNINYSTFEEGEERTLLGKKYILHIDTTKEEGYYFKGNDLVLCVGENSTIETRKKALVKVYREAMEQILPEIAERCQEESGIRAKEWRIRDMKTRWGSCNTKEKRIWINVWLIEKNPMCIRAVVYHELAHLRCLGHNKAFYKLLEEICPEYREAEKQLKGIN